MIEAICVKPEGVIHIWPLVSGFIRRAYDRQFCLDSFEAAEADVISGKTRLWVAWDGKEILGAAITEIWNKPNGKVCAVIACGGRHMGRWVHLLRDIEEHARIQGCALMHFEGRRGWKRILSDYETRLILEKKL